MLLATGTLDTPLRVLIVDDQKTMRSILRGLLHQTGIRDIPEADDGKSALKFLRDPGIEFPDLIICDLHMENISEIEFCRAVRRGKQIYNSKVPILILTGDKDPLLHEVAFQVGATAVMTKPINAEQLRKAIAVNIGFSLETAV